MIPKAIIIIVRMVLSILVRIDFSEILIFSKNIAFFILQAIDGTIKI